MKKSKFLSALFMAIVMMAMCPMKMWAQDPLTVGDNTVAASYDGAYYSFTPEKTAHYAFASEQPIAF